MKINKITTAITAAVLLGSTSIVSADAPSAPAIYNNGPLNPQLNMTNMRDTEKAAFALFEGLMQATEAIIYVNGCTAMTADVTVSADGDNASGLNYIRVDQLLGLRLDAAYNVPVPGFGQGVNISQAAPGYIGLNPVFGVDGRYVYNEKSNLMVNEVTQLSVIGQLGAPDVFRSSVIKDFYHGDAYGQGSFYEIYDYGLQVLSKEGYPVNKYWQKSKAIRDNGQQGCTVFQKDRLVGVNECRIVLETTGQSQPGFFYQTGTLSVSPVNPVDANGNANSAALDDCRIL